MTVKRRYIILVLAPPLLWLLIFFVLPFIVLLFFSFFERGIYGNIVYNFTLDNYSELTSPVYLGAFTRTLGVGILNAILTFLIGYPVAYYLAFKASDRAQQIMVAALILPFWTNYLSRTYAWLILLGEEGAINQWLISARLVSEPLNMLFTPFSVMIGLLYNYLPFMILALYATLVRIDKNYLNVAKDLGASSAQTFFRVTFPLSLNGVFLGALLVFTFSIADYIIPNILGGSKYLLVSNIIANQFVQTRNIPLGASMTAVFMLLIFVFLWIQSKLSNRIIYE